MGPTISISTFLTSYGCQAKTIYIRLTSVFIPESETLKEMDENGWGPIA